MRNIWLLVVAVSLAFPIFSLAQEKSVFEQPSAQFTPLDGKIKYLQEGCKLYTDKNYTLKERPRQLSSTRYILAPFSGCTVRCDRGGTAFLLALVDPISQEQTKRVQAFLEENKWTPTQDISPFILFYTNGADRPGQVYWKIVAQGEQITCPNGSILCYRYQQ